MLARSSDPVTRRRATVVLSAIVAVALLARLYGLDHHLFWFDEGLLADLDILWNTVLDYTGTIWRTTTYNPGWAFVVWLTSRVGGVSLWTLRLPSAVAGVLNTALMYPTARTLGSDRPTALAAALLAGLAWPLVEYSQQILPYAAMPLAATGTLWGLAKIDRKGASGTCRGVLPWCLLLAAIAATATIIHNSFIMLLPFIGVALGTSAARQGLLRMPPAQPRKLAAYAACLGWITLVAVVFYLPKRGEGYRTYLDPYYATTFRDHLMGYGPFTDNLYKLCVARPHPWLDCLYFGLSRTYDVLLYGANLFSPTYVTAPWGVAAVFPVGLACAGLCAALRRNQGALPIWLGFGTALTFALLFVLSLVRLFPYGGIRQLLFLSSPVILLTASGWRAAGRRWPAAITVLSLTALGAYAFRAPSYYHDTAAKLNERTLLNAFSRFNTRNLVVPEFEDHYFVMRHRCRHVYRTALMDTHWPRFSALLHHHEPFLLFTRSSLPLTDFARGTSKSPAYGRMFEDGFDFSDYDVTPLIGVEGGCFRGGQPNPGTFLYYFRPRTPSEQRRRGGYGRRAIRMDPADGSRTERMLNEITVQFDEPMDPATLTPQSIQISLKDPHEPSARWVRCAFATPPIVTYEPTWNTALLLFDRILDPALYEVVVTSDVRNAAGAPLAGGPRRFTFLLKGLRK